MEPLPRSWLIMVSLCTILHGHGILAKIMARSWQDLGKATKELAMDLGKDAMASNTGVRMFSFFFRQIGKVMRIELFLQKLLNYWTDQRKRI